MGIAIKGLIVAVVAAGGLMLFGLGAKAQTALAESENSSGNSEQTEISENEVEDTQGEAVGDVAEGHGEEVSDVAKVQSDDHGQAVSSVAKDHGEEVSSVAKDD